MTKLQDMFTQARRSQGGSGIGFLGKNKAEVKPRVAALVIEFPNLEAGNAEAALKAGADGLLFTWDGKDTARLEALKQEIDSTKTSGDNVVCGLHISSNWEKLERETLESLKENGVNYIVLPLEAPARLLTMHVKDLELIITVPMRQGEMYPLLIRNLTAFDNINAVYLNFGLADEVGTLTIEDVLSYRAVREAVRFPSLLKVPTDMSEADAYALASLGVQAVVLTANDVGDETKQQIKSLRGWLEKLYQEEKEKSKGGNL